MNPIELELNQIEVRLDYCYRLGSVANELEHSLKKYGILQPLVLVRDGGSGYFLIDGIKRWNFARQQKLSGVRAFVYPLASLAEVYEGNLVLNEASGGLSTAEKLLAVRKSRQLEESVQASVLEITGLNKVKELPAILEWFRLLPVDMQIYLHESSAGLKWMARLRQYPFTEYHLWFELGRGLQFKARELAEILDQVLDISLGKGVTPIQLYELLKVKKILDSGQTPQQKAQQLKKVVAEMRYPELSRINNEMQDLARKVGKESKSLLSLQWDPTLEKNNIQLTANLRTAGSVNHLKSVIENKELLHLIEKSLKTINQLGD